MGRKKIIFIETIYLDYFLAVHSVHGLSVESKGKSDIRGGGWK